MLGKGNLSFGRALFNLKEFTPINLHIFSIAPPVALFSVLTADQDGPWVPCVSPQVHLFQFFLWQDLCLPFHICKFLQDLRKQYISLPPSFFFYPRDPSNHGHCFLLLGWEPLGILEMGNSDSSYPQVPPGSLPGLSCKMVVRDPLVGYIQVPRAFISNILLSLQVSSSSAIGAPGILDMGAPRDPNNEIFFSWSRFIIKYIFHKVYYVLDERTKIGSDFYGLPIQSLFHVLMVH